MLQIFVACVLAFVAGGSFFMYRFFEYRDTILESYSYAQDCPTTPLTSGVRAALVDQHNRLRSSLAYGKEATIGGKFAPQGKNIYKLVYDCDLEAQAQAWADQCTFSHSPNSRNASENIFYGWGGDISPAMSVPTAVTMWWGELAKYGISDPQNRLTLEVFNSGVGHFTAMAWGKSTRIGCGYGKNCVYSGNKAAYVVCQYRQMGNILNQVIYELGLPCTVDAHCTTFPGSKCSTYEGTCYL